MENLTKVPSLKTNLKERTLWFDGHSSFNPNVLLDAIQRYDIKYVDEITDIVKEYNKHHSKDTQLELKNQCNELHYDWILPDEYKNLDVVNYIALKHADIISNVKLAEMMSREIRLASELLLYKQRGLFNVLRTIIYIINTLTKNNIVWGVGRGSSVSSYVLYVLQVHDVDSFAYQLTIDEFLHD